MVIGVVWGSVAEWVGAIGTVGALVGALLLLNKQRQSFDQQAQQFRWQADDRHADRLERERRQAAQIGGWVEQADNSNLVGFVANGSDAPIYSCVLFVKDVGCYQEFGEDSEIVDQVPYDKELVFAVVPPNSTQSFPVALTISERTVVADMPFPGPGAEVGFVDAAGLSWLRNTFGELTKTEFPPRIC